MSQSVQGGQNSTPPTDYEVVYTADGEKTLSDLEQSERNYVRQKLTEIATSEFRDPWEWDYTELDSKADGRFCIGKDLRVFADIESKEMLIRIHHIGRRENLYR